MPRSLTLLAIALGIAAPAAAQAPPEAPEAFALTAVEEAYLDQVLGKWETQSDQVNTFSCDFTRLVYDPVFGPAGVHKLEEDGTLSYQQPDKGSFQIERVRQWDAKTQRHEENPSAIGEHWVCDGESVYEYKTEQRQLVVRLLPEELRGKNIVNGPLPFLFGAKADDLKRRYWMKIDPRTQPGQVRLVAAPKTQADAANYTQVELLLDAERMLPTAMQVHQPDGSRTVYTFAVAGAQVNSRVTALWNQLFSSPRTPIGWTRVDEGDPAAQAQAAPEEVRR